MDTEKCYQLTMSCRCCRSICFLGENDFNLQVFFWGGGGWGSQKRTTYPTELAFVTATLSERKNIRESICVIS